MCNENVKDKVIEIISYNLSIDKELVKEDANLESDLGADSLDIIELIIDLEWEYNITLYEEELEIANTVGKLIELVESKIKD